MTNERRLLDIYERLLRPLAHYPTPDYSLTRRVNDGVARGLPRLAFCLQWSLYAAAIVALLVGVGRVIPVVALSPAWMFALATGALAAVKVWHVAAATERPRLLWHTPDLLDWLSDVSACGSMGALLALKLLGHPTLRLTPSLIAIAVLFALTFPWSSP